MVLVMARPKYKKKYHLAWNAWKRCCKKVDSQGEHFTGIHDRFLRDPVYRESLLTIGWTEQKCKGWDEIAKEDHTCRLTPEEKKRYQGQWYLTLNKASKNGPMKLRSDFRAAVLMKNRLHHESGKQVEERLHSNQQRRWRSSSSTSWWNKSECYNWFRLQSITTHCNRRGVETDTPHTRVFLEHFYLVHTSACAFTP